MMTGECCCLVGTNLRMYGLMTKLTLSLLEYIILLFEYYVSHYILDEVVHPAPPNNCSSFAPRRQRLVRRRERGSTIEPPAEPGGTAGGWWPPPAAGAAAFTKSVPNNK